ncbi:MAG: hypothetical protein Aurels2KO_21870 [Aureliella sp.]
MTNTAKLPAILSVFLTSLAIGCGGGPATDYSQLGLVQVAGKVTLDGKPVEGAAVFFFADDETYCFGVTDSNGRYSCMLNSEKSGITPGEKRVEISSTRNPLGDAAEMQGDGLEEDPDAPRQKKNVEKIPECYNSGSKLKVTISESDSNFDFDLRSDCSSVSAR